ncbi:hypothetical protein EON65_14195 [archaeon]|nr:MAG: hypothetical protein EON65_14195 [archaeon]
MNSIVQHSSRRYAYLLNDVLLLTAVPSSSSSKINLNHVIPLDQVSLIDLRAIDSNEDGGAFEIRTPERPYQLVAESESEKRIWLEELESAIFSFMSTREGRKLGWNHAVVRHTFYSAAFYGDLTLLQKHVERMGVDNIDIVDECGMSALHWAALGGQLDAVRYLLDNGADIDCLNGGLNSPLMLAAALGQHNVVLYLLNCGADVEIRNMKDFDCLLMAAIFDNYSSGLFEAVQVLKLRGVDINKQDLSGGSSLHQCTSRNLPSSIQILVDCGADVNLKHGRSGLTPLQMACSGQYPDAETVRILLDKGAMPNWKDSSNYTAFAMILLTHKVGASNVVPYKYFAVHDFLCFLFYRKTLAQRMQTHRVLLGSRLLWTKLLTSSLLLCQSF